MSLSEPGWVLQLFPCRRVNKSMINTDLPASDAQPKQSCRQRFWAFPITRIALYLLLFAAVAAAPAFALLGLLRVMHHPPGHDPVAIALLSEALYAPSPVLAFWVMVRFADKRPWATAGFNLSELPAGLLGGLAIGAVMLTTGVGLLALVGFYHVTAVTPSVLLLLPLLLYFGVAVSEEILFRGYLFQTLEGRWGSGAALGVTSLMFGLAHLANPVPGETPLRHCAGPLLICLEAGLPLGAAYLLTRRWWLPIGIHWAWDYCEGPIYGCPDSGTQDPHTLLHAVFSGPSFLTGGPFGPEAGLVFLAVGLLTGLLLLQAAIRRGQWQPRPRRPLTQVLTQ